MVLVAKYHQVWLLESLKVELATMIRHFFITVQIKVHISITSLQKLIDFERSLCDQPMLLLTFNLNMEENQVLTRLELELNLLIIPKRFEALIH
jgi:hypothetical protein